MSLSPLNFNSRLFSPPLPATLPGSTLPPADKNSTWGPPAEPPSASVPIILPPQLKSTQVPELDPVTRGELHLDPDEKDVLLNLTMRQKLNLKAHNSFIDIPKQVYHGLRGDEDFTGTHLMNIAAIPYYMGGGFLAASFAAGGGNKLNVARQASGVVLYYLGTAAANAGIDEIVKKQTGVDLGSVYQSPDDDIHKAFSSVNFARYDLWSDDDYERISKKMKIPDTIADPRQEVRQRTRRVISETDTDKLILGNILAAIGAGYIAHRIPWARLMPSNIKKDLTQIWRSGATGQANETLAARIVETGHLAAKIGLTLGQFIVFGHKDEPNPNLRKIVLTTLMSLSGIIGWRTMESCSGSSRTYKSPELERLAPELQNSNPAKRSDPPNRLQDPEMQSLQKQQGGILV
jgi:hypothetical protein